MQDGAQDEHAKTDEERLDESRYRTLLDAVPASVFALSPELRLEYVNQYWVEYSGMGLAESQGLPRAILHPDDQERVVAEAGEHFRHAEPFTMEYRARRADGEYRWHLSHTLPGRDQAGNVLGWVGTSIDIDDRKRAEDRQAFLWEAGRVLAASLDLDTTLPELARLSIPHLGEGCEIELLEGDRLAMMALAHAQPEKERAARELHERYPPALQGPHPAAFAIQGGEPVITEVRMERLPEPTGDDGERWFAEGLGDSTTLTVPLVGHGPPLGAVTFIRPAPEGFTPDEVQLALDLGLRAGMAVENARLYRESRQTSEELRIANAAQDELLGLVSHELRTPLTTITGNADLLIRRATDLPEETRLRALSDIRRDAERLQRLVENMLALSQLEAEGIVPEPLLLQRALPRLIAVHRRRVPSRQVTLEVEPGLPPVLAHPTYFDQVVENLLGNAEKYSKPETTIEVRASLAGEACAVVVADRGAGITEEEAEVIFAPFFRTPHAKGKAGMGLGLAVCKRLVEALGGKIWARPREGGGTEMGFTLPLETAGQEPE